MMTKEECERRSGIICGVKVTYDMVSETETEPLTMHDTQRRRLNGAYHGVDCFVKMKQESKAE